MRLLSIVEDNFHHINFVIFRSKLKVFFCFFAANYCHFDEFETEKKEETKQNKIENSGKPIRFFRFLLFSLAYTYAYQNTLRLMSVCQSNIRTNIDVFFVMKKYVSQLKQATILGCVFMRLSFGHRRRSRCHFASFAYNSVFISFSLY